MDHITDPVVSSLMFFSLIIIIIIIYLTLHNCVNTNEYREIERITWNHTINSVRFEYLKLYSGEQLFCIWLEYFISYKSVPKKKS